MSCRLGNVADKCDQASHLKRQSPIGCCHDVKNIIFFKPSFGFSHIEKVLLLFSLLF